MNTGLRIPLVLPHICQRRGWVCTNPRHPHKMHYWVPRFWNYSPEARAFRRKRHL